MTGESLAFPFFWCAWRRTFLMGESCESALVVGRIPDYCNNFKMSFGGSGAEK